MIWFARSTGLLDSFISRVVEFDINLALVFQHAEAARRRIEQIYEGSRQNMLPRMLLQVIEPPQPIDLAAHPVANFRRRSLDDMQHTLVFSFEAINNARVPQHSRIVRLTAAGRIKRGAIQSHRDGAIVAFT